MNTTLFTLSRSWQESTWLFEQLAFASKYDVIVLTQDAVLALQSPINLASFSAKCAAATISVVALEEDCQVRGIDNQYALISLISYDDYVALLAHHSKQVCW